MRHSLRGSVSGASATFLLCALCVAPLHVNAQVSPNAQSAKNKQVKSLTLARPVSLRDTLTALEKMGNPEQEIKLGGDNTIGGFRPDAKKSLDSQVQWAEHFFQHRYHITPAVTGIDFASTTTQTAIDNVKTSLSKVLSIVPQTAQEPADARAFRARSAAKKEHRGTAVDGTEYSRVFSNYLLGRSIYGLHGLRRLQLLD